MIIRNVWHQLKVNRVRDSVQEGRCTTVSSPHQWCQKSWSLWTFGQSCLSLQKSAVFFFFLCTHPFSVDLALPTGARALSRIYICTISAGLLSTFTRALSTCPSAPGLFNYVGSPPFNPFLALSLKMERPCSPSWKRKSVICRGSVGRHLG